MENVHAVTAEMLKALNWVRPARYVLYITRDFPKTKQRSTRNIHQVRYRRSPTDGRRRPEPWPAAPHHAPPSLPLNHTAHIVSPITRHSKVLRACQRSLSTARFTDERVCLNCRACRFLILTHTSPPAVLQGHLLCHGLERCRSSRDCHAAVRLSAR
jgi:hypothetical protein